MPRQPVRTLRDLAVAVDRGFADDDWSSPAMLLGIEAIDGDDGGGLVVAATEPVVDHPVDALRGVRVPEQWVGLGVVAHGWGVPLDDPLGDFRSRERVRVVDLFDRSGRGVALLRRKGHPAVTLEHHGVDGGSAGAVPDAILRALHLPTPPPPVSTLELYAVLWLEGVIALRPAARRRPVGSWSKVAALHPALALLNGDGNGRRDLPFLVEAARALARVGDWSYLRGAVGEGRYPWLRVDPGAAQWMDDGMFARTVVGGSPSLADLRAELAAVVAGPVLQQIDAALDAWNLLSPGCQSFKTPRRSADEDDGLGWDESHTTVAADSAGEAAIESLR